MFPIKDDIPSRRRPILNWTIIILCIVVFLLQDQYITSRFGFVPVRFWFKGELEQIITYMFLHANLIHIWGNMYFLYVFGDNVEDKLGRVGYLVLYLSAGVAGAITHAFFYPYSHVPLIGGSGAISGVLGAYMVMFPSAGIYTVIFWSIFRVPAILFIGLWAVMNYIYALLGVESGVAWWAHIGGFLTGIPFGIIGRIKMWMDKDEDLQLFN